MGLAPTYSNQDGRVWNILKFIKGFVRGCWRACWKVCKVFCEYIGICVADRENGAVQCFENSKGTFEFSVPVPATLKKVYSIDAAGTKIAVLGGPDSRS